MKKIIVITGQTATGKTDKALEIASKQNGELINCDSRQIYKQLNVITGKDLDQTDGLFNLHDTVNNFWDIGTYSFEKVNTPIWLYDIVRPSIPFSAFDYKECVIHVLQDIFKRGKTAIIVGGTYFYLKQLLYSTIQTFVEPDTELRKELETKSVTELQQLLINRDEKEFLKMNTSDKNNPHRLIRKIELSENRNETPSKKDPTLQELFDDLQIELHGYYFGSKDNLRKAITQRVEKRLQEGAIQEVEILLSFGYTHDDPGLKTIGYDQIIRYLSNELSFELMKEEWITKEIQYAKRQLTFMRQNKEIRWNLVD